MSEPSLTHESEVAPRARNTSGGGLRDRRIGVGAIVALAALAALVVWLVVESGGSSSSTTTTTRTNAPVALSLAGLKTLAEAVPQPIYWRGAQTGTLYEVTRTPDRVYVRYLPSDKQAGDSSPYLTIGTYAMQNAFQAMQKSASSSGGQVVNVPGGGIAIVDKAHPTSVYVAYPNQNYQVEVYSPQAAKARATATSGDVQPVVKTPQTESSAGPVAATPNTLRALAASLGHPVYWAGARDNTTYELTQTTAGRVYVRYLPAGVAVGDSKPYLTIATYPLANAFKVTKASAAAPGTIMIKLANGRIGVYAKSNPRNIHIADPGSDVQVEVYDPSPSVPPKLVSSGLVAPVG